ncbi:glycine zipper family protein [Legionella gresilensis]|uniref:glycine zipper family protein n=1 Tax=Legionella gresilensis TaxID=91823 RepID=UPI001041A0BA|nr:glycine zipper family protein [Legionella gresilensis]
MFTIFRGYYKRAVEAVKNLIPEEMFVSDDPGKGKATIEVDIPRAGFLDFSGQRTYDDLTDAWKKDDVVTEDYIQGRMNAGVFCELMYKTGVMTGQIIPTSIKDEGDFFSHLKGENQVSLSFAYFSDSGKPCGFSLISSKSDPDYWIISIIRDATTDAEHREVSIWVNLGKDKIPEDFLVKNSELDSSLQLQKDLNEDIYSLLLQELQSQKLADLLQAIIRSNNTLDLQMLNLLQKQVRGPSEFASNEKATISPFWKTKLKELGATLGSAGIGALIGAGIGALLGTLVFPGIGTKLGALIGAALGGCAGGTVGLSGVGLYELWKNNPKTSAAITILGNAGLGAAAGAIIGTFIFPVIGTGAGALIGAGIGASLGFAINGIGNFIRKNFKIGTGLTTLGSAGIGAGIGALLGTLVFPVLGTKIGAVVGALIGAAIPLIGAGIKLAYEKYKDFSSRLQRRSSSGSGEEKEDLGTMGRHSPNVMVSGLKVTKVVEPQQSLDSGLEVVKQGSKKESVSNTTLEGDRRDYISP